MKKIIFEIGLLLLFSINANCQTDSVVDKCLMRIDNYSVRYSSNYIQKIYLDSIAMRVSHNLDKSTKRKLVTLLLSTDMVLVAHVLLTKMIDGDAAILKYEYQYDGSTIVSTHFYFNNFNWVVNKTGHVIVTLEDKEQINQYWKKRIPFSEN